MATRTQYPFNASWYRYKSLSEINILRRQWNMFETVENYDFIVRSKMNAGNFGTRWYTFLQTSDQLDYNRGRVLHCAQYPTIDFTPEHNKFVQQSTIYVKVSYETSQPSNGIIFSTSMRESERLQLNNDTTLYTNVSTFNATHYFKWMFSSEDERLAYQKAALRLATPSPP
jgi:hypothetical protein